MAITNAIMQMRRGLEADFDPDKMRPGEWAVSIDKKYVRICFSAGVCVRMATYDAFEKDMEEIQAILKECQTIEDAVKQIQSEIDAKEIVIEQYVQNAKSYSEMASDEADRATLEADRAKAEADRASSVANIGIMTEETAGIGKPDGKTILADDYGAISVNVENNNIYKESIGNNIYLNDSTDNKILEFTLYGNAEQYREPTPDNPVEIAVSGSDGSVEVVSCGKNLLENTATTQIINGVTFTVNDDGSVTANGTATDRKTIIIKDRVYFKDVGEYKLSGCPNGGSEATYRLLIGIKKADGTFISDIIDYGNGASFSITQEMIDSKVYGLAVLYVFSGYTANNLTFYPMIRLASDTDDTYEPYKETTSTIPTPYGLAGIKVSSGGNYTDENGQQRICDEIVKYADGSGKRIQRIDSVDMGTMTWEYASPYFKARDLVGLVKEPYDNTKYSNALSTCFIVKNYTYLVENSNALSIVYSTSLSHGQIWAKANDYTDTESFLEMVSGQYLYYELAEPIITDLSAEEIAEIEKLHTFYPITNIFNDSECGIKVKYVTNNLLTTQTELNISPATKREALNNGNVIDLIGKIEKWLLDLKTVAFSGSYSDLTNKPTTLDTYEEIMSNTESGRNAGAIGVKEGFTEVNNSLNKVINISNQIKFEQPSELITVNSFQAWTKGNLCEVNIGLSSSSTIARGKTIEFSVDGLPTPLAFEWKIGLVVGSNYLAAVIANNGNTVRLRNLGADNITTFSNYNMTFTYPI